MGKTDVHGRQLRTDAGRRTDQQNSPGGRIANLPVLASAVVNPWRIVVPVLLVVSAVLVATVLRSDDGITGVTTDALVPSTLSTSNEDPGQPDVAVPFGDGDAPILEVLADPARSADGGDSVPASSVGPTSSSSAPGAAAAGSGSSTVVTDGTGGTASAPGTTATASTASPTTGSTTATSAPSTTPVPTTSVPTTPTTGPPADTPCVGGGPFELVFRDDFNGATVGPVWRQYDSIGNNDYGLRHPAAITVSGGNLVITASMIDGALVSGGMAHAYDQTYGKYVVRVRTDQDPSVAVSGVVLTWPQSQVHPRDGENNIYENLVYDADRSPFYSVIHKPFGQRGDQEYRVHNADGSQFQIMTMEWTPDGITISREGPGQLPFEEWTVTETAEDLIPDVPHHVTIQLDAWKHAISGPVRMQVDYIEVHKFCG